MKINKKRLRKIIREQIDQTGVIESLSDAVQEAVDQGLSLFDIEGILRSQRYGFTASTVTSPLPMILINTRGKR